jgi:glutamate carboxypeptidase
MERQLAAALVPLLQERQEDMVCFLRALVQAESPTGLRAGQQKVQSLLANELAEIDFVVRQVARPTVGDVLYARPRLREKARPYQLLVGHCDTVWPLGTIAQMPVSSEPGIIRGPGVLDMKGGLVQMLSALRALAELGCTPPATPVVLVNADEEVGSPQSTPLIRRLARGAARAFVLEPAFGRSGKLKTARKAAGRFTVIVKGRAAHSGTNPEEGVSAILEMSHQVQRLFALNDAARGITVNVGTIDGGLRPNVIAPEVKAVVDVRVPTQPDAEHTERAIRGLQPVLAGTQIEVQGGFGRPPMEPKDRNQALWRLARQLGEELGLNLEQAAVGGASDGNTTSQYTATLDGLGSVGDGAHPLHEQVDISQMATRAALLAMLLMAPLPRPIRESAEGEPR